MKWMKRNTFLACEDLELLVISLRPLQEHSTMNDALESMHSLKPLSITVCAGLAGVGFSFFSVN